MPKEKQKLRLCRDEVVAFRLIITRLIADYPMDVLRADVAEYALMRMVFEFHQKLCTKAESMKWSGQTECTIAIPMAAALALLYFYLKGDFERWNEGSYERRLIQDIAGNIDQTYCV